MMDYLTYSITARWCHDPLPPREIGEAFLETLKRLEPLSPSMNNWLVRDGPVFHGIPAPTSSSEMAALVEQSLEWKYPDGP